MHDNRLFGFAPVLLSGVCAGSMDSRNGNAIVTPAPLRNVRRERCFLVMNMAGLLTISLAFEMERFARCPGRARKSDNLLLRHPASRNEPPAYRNIEPRGQERTSSVFVSQR